jgi:hypothetical protein
LHIVDRLADASAQVVEGDFVVFPSRHFNTRQPRDAGLGTVARDLHLARERQHVGRQLQRQVRLAVELACLGVGLRLVEPGQEVVEAANERRHGGRVQRK